MPPKTQSILLTDFDRQTVGTGLQLLKVIIPFTEPEQQKIFAIIIRILEFNMTIDFFTKDCFEKHDNPKQSENILNEIKKYCPPESGQQFDMIMRMMQMQKMSDIFNSASAGNDGKSSAFSGSGISSPFDMLAGMLTPEQMKKYKEFEKNL